jgi:hypothetical protein
MSALSVETGEMSDSSTPCAFYDRYYFSPMPSPVAMSSSASTPTSASDSTQKTEQSMEEIIAETWAFLEKNY